MTIKIVLTRGLYSIIDNKDCDLVNYKWTSDIRKTNNYAMRRIKNNEGIDTSLYLHRIILERIMGRKLLRNEICDHTDGDGLNNRRNNLRVASFTLNNRNSKIRTNDNKTSKYKGLAFIKETGRWKVRICVNKNQIHLGHFKSEIEAAQAYNEAALKYFGEFARINEI